MTLLTFPPRNVALSPETEAVYRLVIQVLAFTHDQQELFMILVKMAIERDRQAQAQ